MEETKKMEGIEEEALVKVDEVEVEVEEEEEVVVVVVVVVAEEDVR